MNTVIKVDVRPCHRQYAADIRKTVEGTETDCVLICGGLRISIHQMVLSIATGLLQKHFGIQPTLDEIVMNERYLPLMDKFLNLIYYGQTSFAGDLLPLFRRMNHSIQLKLTISYLTIMDPESNPWASNESPMGKQYPYPPLQGQENEAAKSVSNDVSQVLANRPALAPLDINQDCAVRSRGLESVAASVAASVVPSMVTKVVSSVASSVIPSVVPSVASSVTPSVVSSVVPSVASSVVSSVVPSVASSVIPSVVSSVVPSVDPNEFPCVDPNEFPCVDPNEVPCVDPNEVPCVDPNEVPNVGPNVGPYVGPNVGPYVGPNVVPNVAPRVVPSVTGNYFISLDIGNMFEQYVYDAILSNELIEMRFYAQIQMTYDNNYLNEILTVLLEGL